MSNSEKGKTYFNSKLIDGFIVKDDKIIKRDDSQAIDLIIENKPLDVLNLSTRSINSLYRGQIMYLTDLLGLSLSELKNTKHLGDKSICEITDKLNDYLTFAFDKQKNNIAKVNDDVYIVTLVGNISKQIPIEKLRLSVRPYHCLKSINIDYISQLVPLSFEELKSIRNMGQKSALEVSNALDEFTRNDKSYIFSKQKLIRIPDENISVLNLSENDSSLIKEKGITMISQIINYTYYQINDIFDNFDFSKRLFDALEKYKRECVLNGKVKDEEDIDVHTNDEHIYEVKNIILTTKRKLLFLDNDRINRIFLNLLKQLENNPISSMQIHDERDIIGLEELVFEYKKYLCSILSKNQYTGVECNEFKSFLPDFINDVVKDKVVDELLQSKKLK